MPERCPDCLAPATVIDSRRCSNGSRRRRHECQACGTRWSSHQGEQPGQRGGMPKGHTFKARRLRPAEVRMVLESPASAATLAQKLGCSRSAIHAIRAGRSYSSLFPELPRRSSGLSCLLCEHWSGGRCGMGFPDPEEEGLGFAGDCSLFAA